MARDPRDVEDLAEVVGLQVWPSFLERACCDKKEIFLNGGWRGGKSNTGAFIVFLSIVLDLLPKEGKHLLWLVASDYKYTVPEFNYILGWANRLQLNTTELSTPMIGSRHVVFSVPGMPGTVEIETKSGDDPTSLGGRAPDMLLACEAGLLSEEARYWILGRTAERNATVIWSGTFENEDGKAQFAWFEEESEKAWTSSNSRQAAFRLPTWENLSLYASCSEMIRDDPSLSLWCPPDSPHGPLHSSLSHPMIRKLEDQWKDRPKDWRKRFGGEPVGVRNPVYEWASEFPDHYLKPMPEGLKPLRSAGGMDFGTVHPSAITLGSVMSNGETWVWRSIKDTSGSLDWIWATKEALAKKYHIRLWGADPMVKYNPTYLGTEAMSGSLYAREARVGIVNGVQQDDKLFFDSSDPGVVLLFREMQRVHRRRNSNGQVAYVRDEDDMTASFEDMMAMLHGQPILKLPKRWRLPALAPVAPAPYRSVS